MMLDSNPLRMGLPKERAPGSCVFVIFGGTGDLAERKLLPALYHLHLAGHLPRAFAVIAYASQEMTDESYRDWVHSAIVKSVPHAPTQGPVWDSFSQALFYCRRGGAEISSLEGLRERIREVGGPIGAAGNCLFYLAIPPFLVEQTVEGLQQVGLTDQAEGWKRLVVEKPFGTDLESAQELNRALQAIFPEDRIYRIDHYLGKETVQNILVFRFANEFVEPLLNREHVDHIQITVAETLGIEKRGAFYDSTGALRDIMQNHMLQMMALTMMDRPESLEAEAVRDAKAALLRGVRPIDPEQISEVCVRGQYGRGLMLGEDAPAYREEESVTPDSTTETFVTLKLFVDNPRWRGVPVYLRTGKHLPKRVTEIGIQLRCPSPSSQEYILSAVEGGAGGSSEVFRDFGDLTDQAHRTTEIPKHPLFGCDIPPDVIAINVQPDDGISIRFESKVPGLAMRLQPVRMDFRYASGFGTSVPEAYERLLLDAMLGDASLYSRADAVEASWAICDPILDGWKLAGPPINSYSPGTWGPKEADDLIARDGRQWRRL